MPADSAPSEASSATRTRTIIALGSAQTIAWASSYYLVAILADPMARELGISPTRIYAAFSAALLISALLGPKVGRTIDRFGGRGVLGLSNGLFILSLVILGLARSELALWAGWLTMGTAMSVGLYDAAFATLGRIYGETARSAITGITLIAGFASTVGWPLTTWGEAEIGWRMTCLAWAGVHLVLALPLNLLVPRIQSKSSPSGAGAAYAPSAPARLVMDRTMWLLGFAFAAGWVVSTAMAAHLPRLLEAAGATPTQAVAAAALIGPAQVGARVIEAWLMSRVHPLWSARAAMIGHPVGAGLLLAGGGLMAVPFTLLHGAGNGVLTIARGTVPLSVYGPENYGYRLGVLGAPARIAQAGAPLAFGVLIEVLGAGTLWVSAGLCLASCMALMAIGPQRRT